MNIEIVIAVLLSRRRVNLVAIFVVLIPQFCHGCSFPTDFSSSTVLTATVFAALAFAAAPLPPFAATAFDAFVFTAAGLRWSLFSFPKSKGWRPICSWDLTTPGSGVGSRRQP
jgi:hypothetical protein